MRFAVVVLACMLAAANAQQNTGKYTPDNGRYQYNRYNQYSNQYNNRYNPYNNRYNNNQYNRYNQYNPFDYRNQQPTYTPFTFKPFVSTTPVPRPSVTVTPAPSVPPKVTAAAAVSPTAAPAPVTLAPIAPVAPVAPVAPFVPIVTAARVAADSASAETVRYGNEINPDGSYSYFFETNNGIAAQAQGEPRNFGGNPPVIPDVAQGAFSWYSPEGQLISINWVADENGYQPTGDAIPVPPPLPDQIARALAYVARSAPVPAVAIAKASAESN